MSTVILFCNEIQIQCNISCNVCIIQLMAVANTIPANTAIINVCLTIQYSDTMIILQCVG